MTLFFNDKEIAVPHTETALAKFCKVHGPKKTASFQFKTSKEV